VAGTDHPIEPHLHLDLEARADWQLQRHAIEPGVAGLGDNRGIRSEEGLDLPDYFGPHQLRLGRSPAFEALLGTDTPIFQCCRITLLHLAGETRKEVAQTNPAEIVPIEVNAVLIGCQYAATAGHRRPPDGRIVVENRADAENSVRPIVSSRNICECELIVQK